MSVIIYSLKKDGERQLSPHFKVKEFRCKDGSDEIKIESGLLPVLEMIYDHFRCSRIDITSGYRTAAHDKKVGGKGGGNHVQGKAVDFVAYDRAGAKIPSAKIVLYLEDIGFRDGVGVSGVGYRCGKGTYATHMDVNYRAWDKWWFGDEYYSMSKSIGQLKAGCYSFYDYIYGPGKWQIKAKITAVGGLNARKGAGTGYARVKTYATGSTVTIVEKSRDLMWGKTTDGLWISLKYVGVL